MSDDPGDLYTSGGDGAMDSMDATDDGGLASDQAGTTFDGITGDLSGDLTSDYDTGPAGDDTEPAPSGDGTVHVDYEGIQFDAGPATLDLTGDGVADTAVQDHGYQVEYYVDSTGDGVADELTITDADGDLISQEVVDPATGEWIDVTGQNN